MKTFKKLFIIVMALVMAAALTACGSTTDTGTGSGTSQTTGTQGASKDRKASNSVVVGISQELDSLDPHSCGYAGTREVLFNIFEGLVKPTSTGDIEPAVASGYTVSDDALTITFTLRDGVKFSDGTEVTPEDVKYSLERYADIQGGQSAFSVFKEAVIVDEKTVQVVLSEPNTEFIYQLTCAILPESNDANIDSSPVGVGPFKYESYTPGSEFVVVKNENYWKEGCPSLDKVTFKIVTNASTAVMELAAGSLDIYEYLSADQASTLGDGFNILEGTTNYVQAMFLNNKTELFDDVRVRQALCYAVDKDIINEMVMGGKSTLIGTGIIPGLKTYYNKDTDSTYKRDVNKAKELLAEAGYPDGISFTITVPNNYAPHESTAQVLVENLAEAGIKAQINLVEFTSWYSDVYVDRNYEATVISIDGTLAPSSWLGDYFATDAPKNFANYSNAEYDALYAQALAESDSEKKVAEYKEMQQILADDAASVFLQDLANLVAVNSNLTGYTFYPVSAIDMSVVSYK